MRHHWSIRAGRFRRAGFELRFPAQELQVNDGDTEGGKPLLIHISHQNGVESMHSE